MKDGDIINPCVDYCWLRFRKHYTKNCDHSCDYAKSVKENKDLKSKIDELCHTVPEYEQLEQMWPGCELCKGKALNGLSISKDSTFGLSLSRWAYGEKPEIPYCPNCSRPLTKEAWQDLRNKIGMLVKGALNTNETD